MTCSETKQGERITVVVDADLKELIPGFIKDWKKGVESSRKALENGNYETIRKLGHNMKGSGGGCGFNAVTNMGGLLEEAARNMEPDVIRKTLNELASYFKRVDVKYE